MRVLIFCQYFLVLNQAAGRPRFYPLKLRFFNHEVMACISPGRKSGGRFILCSVSPERTTGIRAPKYAVLSALTVIFLEPIHGLASMAFFYRAFSTRQIKGGKPKGTQLIDSTSIASMLEGRTE